MATRDEFGPLLRCRRCETATRDPIGHLKIHGVDPTLAIIWEQFALIGANKIQSAERDAPSQTETLF